MTDTPGSYPCHGAPAVVVGCADDYHTWSDLRLLQGCREGDDRAWDSLLERHGSLVYSATLKFDLPDEDVAFVFQTIFLEVLMLEENLMGQPDLGSWLLTETLWLCREFTETSLCLQDEDHDVGVSACARSIFKTVHYGPPS